MDARKINENKIPRLDQSHNQNLKPVQSLWEWQELGACKGIDTESFYLEYGVRGPTKRKKEIAAVSICMSCPVIQQCREHALRVPETYGVWGGLTEEERRVIIKRKGRAWR